MFKVPDWEDGIIPKNKINPANKINKKERKAPVKPVSLNKVKATIEKQILKVKKDKNVLAKKRKHNGSIINNKKKKVYHVENNIDVSNIDTDKLDEVLLNAKKTKFYEPLKKDDVEHLLFKEERNNNNISQHNKLEGNGREFVKIIDKKKIHSKKAKINKKNMEIPELEKDRLKRIFKVKKIDNVELNQNASTMSTNQGTKFNKRKEKLKHILETSSNRNSISITGNKLRQRMLERLKAAQFRYINEKLYTSSGREAHELFNSDPAAFQTYHQGYQQQVKKWPVNPLDLIVKRIQKMPKTHTIADMGCGEAALSKRIPHKVRSFDLVSTAPRVETCDMAHTPLLAASVEVAVYCLSLMGTELTQYLMEASRVLKMGGHLLIAEVESRFTDVDAFARDVTRLGFKLNNLDKQHQVFFFMEFVKIRDPPVKRSKLPALTLKPCLYKKR